MTDIITAMENRHAVRAYDPEKNIPKEITDMLREKIDLLNAESGLHIQLVTDEPKAFDSFMAHYGKFSGVTDYIALIGRKSDKLNEICGYYGGQLLGCNVIRLEKMPLTLINTVLGKLLPFSRLRKDARNTT